MIVSICCFILSLLDFPKLLEILGYCYSTQVTLQIHLSGQDYSNLIKYFSRQICFCIGQGDDFPRHVKRSKRDSQTCRSPHSMQVI